MKTSPELLTDILGVLGQINAKMDMQTAKASSEGDASVKASFGGTLGSLLGKKGVAGKMAEDIEKLKTAMKGFNLVRLKQLNENMEKYVELSGKRAKNTSSWAIAAQDIGKSLMHIAGGIGMFAGVMALSAGVLGIRPVRLLGFVLGTMTTLALSMVILNGAEWIGGKIDQSFTGQGKIGSINRSRNANAIKSAKDMGIALMTISGSIVTLALGLKLAGQVSGGGLVGALALVPITVLAVGGSIALLSGLVSGRSGKTVDGKTLPGGKSKDAIQAAKDMGIAMMVMSGGVLAFAVTIALVPKILGIGRNEEGKLTGVGSGLLAGGLGILTVAGIILGMGGVFFLLGKMGPSVAPGIATAAGLALGMGVISLGVLAVAKVSKMILDLNKASDTKADGTPKGALGKVLGTIGNVIGGLGIFGLFVISSTALFIGLSTLSVPILIGAGVATASALALIKTAEAVDKVGKAFPDKSKARDIRENISLSVSAVMAGIFDGVMGSGIAGKSGEAGSDNLSLKELRQFRRVTKAVRLLGKVSSSLTQFAEGLSAFSKVGEIASLRYKEVVGEDGVSTLKPIIGENGSIHVEEIATSITRTFGLFIGSLVTETDGLTKRQARALKILGKSLTGEKGIIAGVSSFADTLKTFSEFGAEGRIFVPKFNDDGTPVTDESGNPIKEGVSITTITENIVNSFGTFVEKMAAKAPQFEMAGASGRRMLRFTEALMGQSKGLLRREKPGILTGIDLFNETISKYAEYGAGGKIPKKDKDGNLIEGQYYTTEEIVTKMVAGISSFASTLSKQLEGNSLESTAKDIESKMGSLSTIMTSFDTLAMAGEGMDKLSNSVGLLATNIGLLVTNSAALDTSKLQSLATVTTQHANATKGVTVSEKSAASSAAAVSSASQPNWDRIGEIIGAKVAEKISLNNSTMDFYFHDWPTGKVEVRTN